MKKQNDHGWLAGWLLQLEERLVHLPGNQLQDRAIILPISELNWRQRTFGATSENKLYN
jgi:hypothetical protein